MNMFEIPHLMVTRPKYLSKIVHFTDTCSKTKYKQQNSTKTSSYQNGLKCLLLCISVKWFRMKDMCLSVKSTVTGSRTASKSAINQFSFLTPAQCNYPCKKLILEFCFLGLNWPLTSNLKIATHMGWFWDTLTNEIFELNESH